MIAIASPKRELGTRTQARTSEIERCLKMHPSHILMMDDDQTLPIEALDKFYWEILEVDGVMPPDILVIDAPNKGVNDSNIRYHPDGTLAYFTISCCLVKATVFDKIDRPWFDSIYAWFEEPGLDDGKINWRVEKKFSDDNRGEDVYFSRKCLEAGLTIKIMSGLKSNHYDL